MRRAVFLPMPGHERDPGDVARADGLGEVVGRDAREDVHGQPGSDAGDRDELEEHVLLFEGSEAVEGQGVVGEVGVDEELHGGADLPEPDVGRHGDGRGVSDAAGLDDDVVGRLVAEGPFEVGDHDGSFSSTLIWNMRALRWQMAAARASEASSGMASSSSPRSERTMVRTCSLSAWP